jgi:hypothetical protein
MYDSEYEKLSPAVVTLKAPEVYPRAVPEVSVPRAGAVSRVTLEPDTAIEDGWRIATDAAPSTARETLDWILWLMSARAGRHVAKVIPATKSVRFI